MAKQGIYRVLSNRRLTEEVRQMVLEGDTSAITSPGQFVNIALEGKFLRRPISVCDWDGSSVTLIYKVVGEGTEQMSLLRRGAKLDLLTGLGNGFDMNVASQKPLLVGGGVGVPPLYGLARRLSAAGREVSVVLGFNTAKEVFLADRFAEVGAKVFISSVDGRCGVKGFVTDVIAKSRLQFDYFYACGPLPMLKALCLSAETEGIGGELSMEERMGCGFGACMGCSCKTTGGSKRICKEGPVLKREEIIW